jgi:pimeloyl-ACP methyl ester carboxylesterase
MATFVLVHGSCHGGWCWRRVEPLLREAGHRTYAPTLSGMGERYHLLHPDIGLAAHVADVVECVFREDLRDIVLVGHSYGGMVITGAAAVFPERIAKLIYLDACVPEHGQSVFDCMPELREPCEKAARQQGDGWLIPAPDPSYWGITDPADAAWLRQRLTPIPIATYREPVRAPAERLEGISRSYVRLTEGVAFETTAAAIRETPGWEYLEISAGHEAMVTHPAQTAAALLACLKSAPVELSPAHR